MLKSGSGFVGRYYGWYDDGMSRTLNSSAACQPLSTGHQPNEVRILQSSMGRKLLPGVLTTLLAIGVSQAQTSPGADKAGASRESGTARGEYIVNNVAVCSQCHTPRDGQGRLEKSHWLEGASLWLQSAEATENWPQYAPRIAGALPGTEEEMVTLLTTGVWKNGTSLRPPMPQFRMNKQDAEAVVAYLKSVKPMAK
jgi:mono/diheme cytochrome c family protein